MVTRFNVEQANRTLPLVRRIVSDIVREYARWRTHVRAFELATTPNRADAPSEEAEQLQHAVQTSAAEIQGFVRELSALGVEFKGYDVGLVDFPAELDGREVYLCWKLGEPAVEYWHEIDAGFAGRQPLRPVAVG